MKIRLPYAVLFLFLFTTAQAAWAVEVGDAAPSFKLKTAKGDLFDLGVVKGNNPVLLIFWATWCPVCKEEVPKVKDFHNEFGPKGLKILAIDVGINDSVKRMGKYITKYDMTYPAAFDNGSKVTNLYGVMGTPTIFIIDRKGTVRYRDAKLPDDLGDHFQALLE